VGDSIVINPNKFARKMIIPVKIVKITLYLDLSLILSSIKPITPESTTVKTKIIVSLKNLGKKRISRIEEQKTPKIRAIPPDSATSVLEFL
jgi:hypothetical protein